MYITDMRKIFVFLFMLSSISAFAKPKPAPLPEALYKATKVFIVNHTGDQSVTDNATEEFPKTNHYTVVTKRADADFVATFDFQPFQVKGNTKNLVSMTLTLPGSDDPVYQTTPRPMFATKGGLTKDCIHDFEKRLEEK